MSWELVNVTQKGEIEALGPRAGGPRLIRGFEKIIDLPDLVVATNVSAGRLFVAMQIWFKKESK